jgi:hypothetical protein
VVCDDRLNVKTVARGPSGAQKNVKSFRVYWRNLVGFDYFVAIYDESRQIGFDGGEDRARQ